MVRKSIFLFITAMLCVLSCTRQDVDAVDTVESGYVTFSIRPSSTDITKNSFNPFFSRSQWDKDDTIGIVAYIREYQNLESKATDAKFRSFTKKGTNSDIVAEFEGSLWNGGSGWYRFFGVYPYRDCFPSSAVELVIPALQKPKADSWDPRACLMIARSEEIFLNDLSDANPSLVFSYLTGWLRLSFSDYDWSDMTHADETVQTVSITADDSVPLVGKVSIRGIPDYYLDSLRNPSHTVTLDYTGKDISVKDLDAFFTLLPVDSCDVTIVMTTDAGEYTFRRKCLSIKSGEILYASMSKRDGDSFRPRSADYYRTTLPDKPSDGDSLSVLLIGHSFGLTSTEYLPDLLNHAQIGNVHIGCFYRGAADLSMHYEDFQKDVCRTSACYYTSCSCGDTCWVEDKHTTIRKALEETPWDIIVLGGGLKEEGDFSRIKASLDPFVDEILGVIYAKSSLRKPPLLAWDLFYPISDMAKYHPSNKKSNAFGKSAADDWKHYCTAAHAVEDSTRISLIISAGAALMKLRDSELNTSETYDFTRATTDYYHASNGAGSYVLACAWFETIFAPIYGKTVSGNGFRVGIGRKTRVCGDVVYAWDEVKDSNAKLIQNCGIEAVTDKFYVGE